MIKENFKNSKTTNKENINSLNGKKQKYFVIKYKIFVINYNNQPTACKNNYKKHHSNNKYTP